MTATYQIVWKDTGKPFDNDLYPPLEDQRAQQEVMVAAMEENDEIAGKLEVRPVEGEPK